MEMIRLLYKGGRTLKKIPFSRQAYIWKKETDYICDVPKEFARQLLQTGEFTPVAEVIEKEVIKEVLIQKKLICEVCGFEAKTDQGLLVHSAKHKPKSTHKGKGK